MRIAHVGLCAHFTENMTYQDNQLPVQNVMDGHDVLYVSSADEFRNGILMPTGYEDKILANGVHLVRLPYVQIINSFVSDRIRKVRGLYSLLSAFNPDVILCHGQCYWSILDVIRYKKAHPEVKLYADTHTAADNSGTNWLSLHVLHRVYYRFLTQKALPYLEKYFYIGDDERLFAIENYGVPESIMEYYPLGGTILSDEEYERFRVAKRSELGVSEGEFLLVHAGKLEPKKKTEMLLRAFAAVPELNAKLVIIGSMPEEVKPRVMPLIEADARIQYLGWKSGEELQEYLCAADLYCQPGKVSAIMQNAVCCRCPVMTYPHRPYTKDLDYGNLLWVETQKDMETVFRQLVAGDIPLDQMREGSIRCANELLDYRALAARLYR